MTLPNLLSVIRLLLIPIYAVVYLTAKTQPAFCIAALILVFSGVTDVLDGYIARKYHKITELGKFLDPLADKLTQITAAVCLAVRYTPFVFLCILILLKELCMLVGGMILLKRNKSMASAQWFGKLATLVIYVVIVAITAMEHVSDALAIGAVVVISFFVLFAFCNYIPVFRESSHKGPQK